MPAFPTSDEVITALANAGIITEAATARHVVVDLRRGKAPVVSVEQDGDIMEFNVLLTGGAHAWPPAIETKATQGR